MSLRISKQERAILESAAEGLSDKEIAKERGLRLSSVRTYWDRMRDKLKASNRAHAVALLGQEKLEECQEHLQLAKSELRKRREA